MRRLFSVDLAVFALAAGLALTASGAAVALGGDGKGGAGDATGILRQSPDEQAPGAGPRLGGGKKPVDEAPADTPSDMPEDPPAPPGPDEIAPDPVPPADEPQPADPEVSPLVLACDSAAAHPRDPGRPATVIGVETADMNIARAIAACEAAREAYPDHARTAYQLGRAYHAGNRPHEAEAAYFAALAADYESAGLAVGFLYQDDNALNRDAADAFPFFRRAAEAGMADAEFEMGWAYENGLGTGQDYAQAAYWYQRAADQGDKLAMNNLGWLYHEGHGVARDPARAVELYRPGAEAGIPIAQYNLGWALANGVGIAQDQAEAAKWYRRAADNGETFAMLNLGYMYLYGEGVDRDPAEALSLFHRADDDGSIAAKSYIGEVYEFATEYYHAETAAWYYVRALKGGDDWPTTRAADDWDRDVARALQRILRDNGFYTGAIDGVMGPGSVAAMKRVLPPSAE